MARIIFFSTNGAKEMPFSLQLDNDIVKAKVRHFNDTPPESATIKVWNSDVCNIDLGWKYVEADNGFYELDSQGDIINETFISL